MEQATVDLCINLAEHIYCLHRLLTAEKASGKLSC